MFTTVGRRTVIAYLFVAFLLGGGGKVWGQSKPKRSEIPVPIYVHSELLAVAENPSSLSITGGALWNPGPEQFCGWAIRDLKNYLGKLSGKPPALMAVAQKMNEGVFVGTFAQFPDFKPQTGEGRLAFEAEDPESFVIEAQGERFFVLGKSRLSVITAIYTLLDRLGCKWFAPGLAWEQLPTLAGLQLDGKLNIASRGPSYQARFFFPSYGPNSSVFERGVRDEEYALWCLRNRMGGSAYTANYHNDPGMVAPELFQKKPELFALAGGKRNAYGLSRANPETLSIAIESAVSYLKENEAKGSYYHSFSVETNDGSPACEESLKKVGNHTATDLNYWFANQVAGGIEKAGLKDKWVGMCSYSDHAGIPSFDLHPRVGVVVTTGLDFSSGGLSVEQRLDGLRQRKCQRLGIYDYLNLITWSLDKPGCSPAADPLLVAANLKRWHEHGATSYLAETSDSWVSGGPGHYLAARLLWDVTSDPRKEVDAYYAGAFGPAAAEARALNEDWAALPMKVQMPAGALPGLPRISRERCARWYGLLVQAQNKVKEKPAYLSRLTALNRYYLYLNLTREYELDLVDPKLPAKEERYIRLLRYVASNRGEGAFHAKGLFATLLAAAPSAGYDVSKWPPEFVALSKNINDENAWRAFPHLADAEISDMFAAAELSYDQPAGKGTFDPRLRLVPADAEPPLELRFPKLHGPPAVHRQYLLLVKAATPKLTFDIVTGSPHGGGIPKRTCLVTDARGNELKRTEFTTDEPSRFELSDVKPGLYTATFPEFGAEQLTVTGGNTFGAMRAPSDGWGFNPMRRTDQKEGDDVRTYFVVPAGWSSLVARLTDGEVSMGFFEGSVIAAEVRGKPKDSGTRFEFPASDKPRVAYLKVLRGTPSTIGLVVEGITLYGPNPVSVLFETLE